jgi:1-acyl-sn-glycerol-3-phosphate acyltransferase
MNGTILPLFRLFCRLDVQGFEKLDKLQEPVILCANHQSDMDPLAVLLALPTRYRKLICPAMGLNRFNAHFQHLGRMPPPTEYSKNRRIRRSGLAHKHVPNRSIKGLFHGIGYTLLTFLFQTFPFPQGSAFRRSLEYTGELIDAGLSILIFPEGRVSVDGSIGRFKSGVSLIAEMTDVPVVPVHINGMHDVLPPQHWFPHRGYVQVTFGSSLRYNRQGHEQFTRTLEDAVRSMKGNNIKKRKKD